MINPQDPFDEEEIAKFLALLDEPLEYSTNYREIKDPLPAFKAGGNYLLGGWVCRSCEILMFVCLLKRHQTIL